MAKASSSNICDIIVLTWNQQQLIKAFIESLLSNTFLPFRLIIIDNASVDGTRDHLSYLKDNDNCQFKIVFNSENKGFVRGMNQGIEISNAPYVCLANNDLIFTKGWLDEIISVFECNNRIGLINPNSNNLGAYPRNRISLQDYAKYLREKYHNLFVETPFCIGFCMVIKRDLINNVGGLSDEFYPIFFEDTDYSMKALKAGFLIGMAKGSYVWHKEHASFKQMGKKRQEYFDTNRMYFFKKWGKILRIAWIVNDYSELQESLGRAIDLAREGNYIWLFCKNIIKSKENIFNELGINQHSGIQFVNFKNTLGLAWQVIKKKKRYDLIITANKKINWFFMKIGYRTRNGLYKDEIFKLKYINQ